MATKHWEDGSLTEWDEPYEYDQHGVLCPECRGAGGWPVDAEKDPETGIWDYTTFNTCLTCMGKGELE